MYRKALNPSHSGRCSEWGVVEGAKGRLSDRAGGSVTWAGSNIVPTTQPNIVERIFCVLWTPFGDGWNVMLRTCAGRCRRASCGGTRRRTFPTGRTRRGSPLLRPCCCLEPAPLAVFGTSLPLSPLQIQPKVLALQSPPSLCYSCPPSRVQNGVRGAKTFFGTKGSQKARVSQNKTGGLQHD